MAITVRYSELYSGNIGRIYRMKDYFSEVEPKHKSAIISYLIDGGEPLITSTGLTKDVFTGESTGCPNWLMTDGVYEWRADYAYYVDRYNLVLPEDFVEHIIHAVG